MASAPASPEPKTSSSSVSETVSEPSSFKPPIPEFEETPAELPSAATSPTPPTSTQPPAPPEEPRAPQPVASAPPPAPLPATPPAGSKSPFGAIIFVVLFILAFIGLAGAAFLYQQTTQLRKQLSDISATIQQQQTQPTTSPTPSIEEIAGTPTPETTISATPSPSAYVSPVAGSPVRPLSIAPQILKTALDFQPNAQFILLKTDNAANAQTAVSKYFFRQDLTTKKYFYVLVSGSGTPEVVSQNIQVTPDNDIPSLNDLVLQNQLGIDLDEALSLVYSKCQDQSVCQQYQAQAQYIKTTSGTVLWQISLYPSGSTQPMVMQINAQTKEILFRTSDFLQN